MSEEVLPSFNQQLKSLRRGESLARCKRFPLDDPPLEGMNEILSGMRRNVNAVVSRIREATGSNFRVESGIMITSGNEAILAVVSVTKQ